MFSIIYRKSDEVSEGEAFLVLPASVYMGVSENHPMRCIHLLTSPSVDFQEAGSLVKIQMR